MSWSKTKQQLENFLTPALLGRVEYQATGYRYSPDKSGMSYMSVDKKKIFNMKDLKSTIKWYHTEQEIKNDKSMQLPVSNSEIEAIRQETKGSVPEDRLIIMARNKKTVEYAKNLIAAQNNLSKSDFQVEANKFLSAPIEESLESQDILMNILAIVDRRAGKKRLLKMSDVIMLKHPIVQYFYRIRCSSD